MYIPIDLASIEAVALASLRMVAFLVIAPPFSYNGFPAQVKGMLAIGLAIAVAPRVGAGYQSGDTGAFLLDMVRELAVGATLGFLVFLVFSAIQSAGSFIDLFGGFQLAQAFDPQAMINGAQFTRLFQLTALALLFASGGYQLIIGGLVRTFDAIPLAGGFDLADPAKEMVTGVTQMFLAALQIAGPLIVVLFLADVGLGLLTRVAPALNAFALGFPLKIMLTVVLSGIVVVALPGVVSGLTDTAVKTILGVTR
ncbi:MULTISPECIES: flagellar biosynthetic protein FliR [Leifsonia]|jgi:flagellar biosynthetic protein FliR|uniref:Flagellar biosynthetic protein FliR n=3 Tax=Leifsonia TaxID=110932 RepID=A0A7W4YJP0_LEIAQ|nr:MULTISPECIES: flagellar biosynthetic protein FliR [Leifsonia]ERK72075.1 putative flagellar biosynthetic protein FliR [Leifsonia aquatica ATCC 14665]MBB2967642.1 flagellar biosynthetic protein FliR [Leifsonia aquatica]NYK09889.1 flagellar biosynthetic protein FliR [Leifsonia naganoensis]